MIDVASHCQGLPVRNYEEGDLVIKEGGRSGALFILRSGSVEIRKSGQLLATISEPGSVLGEISILLDRPHTAEVRAVEASEFHLAEHAETFLSERPEIAIYLARALARKVDTMSCYLVDLKQQYADQEGGLGMVHEVLDSLLQPKR